MSKQSKHKNPRSLLSKTLRIFTVVVVIVLVTVAIIAGIGWWAGWRTEGKFKTAIQVAGLVLIGVGFLGIKGNRDMTRSFEYQYGMSVTKDDSWKRTQHSLKDFAQSYSFLLVMFFAGGLCMVIGWLM
jgi:predicted permease